MDAGVVADHDSDDDENYANDDGTEDEMVMMRMR